MGNLTGFFGSILAAYGILLGGMFAFQRSLLYFPPNDRPEAASAQASGIEAVTVTTADGLDLEHWYHPPVAPDGTPNRNSTACTSRRAMPDRDPPVPECLEPPHESAGSRCPESIRVWWVQRIS